jgi:hypothetical protein
MFVNGGLVGPKSRPKGVGDGQPVNIPALLCFRLERSAFFSRWGDGV